ncbi:hypothetical protein AAZX31_14G098200 [Glycine max]
MGDEINGGSSNCIQMLEGVMTTIKMVFQHSHAKGYLFVA